MVHLTKELVSRFLTDLTFSQISSLTKTQELHACLPTFSLMKPLKTNLISLQIVSNSKPFSAWIHLYSGVQCMYVNCRFDFCPFLVCLLLQKCDFLPIDLVPLIVSQMLINTVCGLLVFVITFGVAFLYHMYGNAVLSHTHIAPHTFHIVLHKPQSFGSSSQPSA